MFKICHGLVVIIWSYARGSGLSKVGETAINVVGYAAQIAAQLGAHIIKLKQHKNECSLLFTDGD